MTNEQSEGHSGARHARGYCRDGAATQTTQL
jgi:hypothetical protein